MSISNISANSKRLKFIFSYITETRLQLFLACLWLIVNVYFYFSLGIKYMTDSPRYIGTAQNILATGEIHWNYNFWSSGYIFFVYLLLYLGFGYKGIAVIQILISGLAARSVFKIASYLDNKKSGYLAAFLYIIWLPLQSWNMYLLTESLFISFSIISFYLILRIGSPTKFLIFTPVILFSASLRPMGIIILFTAIVYLLWSFAKKYKNLKILLLLACVVLGSAGVYFVNRASESYSSIFINLFKAGEVIGGYNGALVEVPPLKGLSNTNSLFEIIRLLFYNPVYSFQFCLTKLVYFFGHIKPFYSIIHNLFIICLLYPVYFYAIKGFLNNQINKLSKIFSLCLISLTALLVMITTEDWDGRYLFPILPFFFIYAAIGFTSSYLIKKTPAI